MAHFEPQSPIRSDPTSLSEPARPVVSPEGVSGRYRRDRRRRRSSAAADVGPASCRSIDNEPGPPARAGRSPPLTAASSADFRRRQPPPAHAVIRIPEVFRPFCRSSVLVVAASVVDPRFATGSSSPLLSEYNSTRERTMIIMLEEYNYTRLSTRKSGDAAPKEHLWQCVLKKKNWWKALSEWSNETTPRGHTTRITTVYEVWDGTLFCTYIHTLARSKYCRLANDLSNPT